MITMIKRMIAALLAAASLAGTAWAGESPVHASLVSEVASFVPGRPFLVGLKLEHAAGWHTYWKDPGSAGVPTSLDWQLPAGVKAGPILWPQPQQVKDSGAAGLISNIYTGTTILMTQIKTSRGFKGPLKLQATARWVMCKDVCIPGKAVLSLALARGVAEMPSKQAPAFMALRPFIGLEPDSAKGYVGASPGAYQGGFLSLLFYAFVGGLILNLMPCVLPVLSLKIFSFVKQAGQDRRKTAILGSAFSAGVLVSFWSMALIVLVLKAAGHSVGWGFQFQNPGFVAMMAGIVGLFAFNLLGVFEIYLPGSATQGLHQAATASGLSGAFANGALATLLATPCTAPFLGTALGFAFTQPGWVLFLFFTAVAVGLALPYQVLSLFPQGLAWMPKPGAWMESFKQLMGFLLLAAVVWLLSVLGAQAGKDAVIGMAAVLLALGLSGWWWGKLKVGTPLAKRLGVVVVETLLVVLVYRGFLKEPLALHNHPQAATASSEWAPYSADGLARLKAQGRLVFLDFTAEWCWTCKVNEKAVLQRPEVREAFKNSHAVLMRADWTSQDPAISALIQSFGRSGVPLYVVYPKGGGQPRVLPEVITPGIVLTALR